MVRDSLKQVDQRENWYLKVRCCLSRNPESLALALGLEVAGGFKNSEARRGLEQEWKNRNGTVSGKAVGQTADNVSFKDAGGYLNTAGSWQPSERKEARTAGGWGQTPPLGEGGEWVLYSLP